MAYVFEPEDLTHIVGRHAGAEIEALIPALTADLDAAYPGAIMQHDRWVFSNAGGIMCKILILHASLNEYLMVCGTPFGSEGHSGRHLCDLWDIVLTGELRTYQEQDLRSHLHHPGDCSHLPRGQANGSRMCDDTWLLEYCRGPIPAMLPFGLLDAFSSTLDLVGIRDTFAIYTKATLRALSRRLSR